MLKLKQRFRHNPPETYGDCRRTTLACLLDLPLDEVPHLAPLYWEDSFKWREAENAWLRSIGYTMISSAFDGSLDDVLMTQKNINFNIYYLLGGNSKNECGHAVIGCNDEIIWDPSLDESGIIGPMDDGFYWIEHLVPVLHLKE